MASARQSVVDEHYKWIAPEGISPLLTAKEATKGSASAAADEGTTFEELISKACTRLSCLFLVPTKKRVSRVKPAETPTAPPTRRTRADSVKIPAPKPSYVSALWREGRQTTKESDPASIPEVTKDGKTLRLVIRRIDTATGSTAEADDDSPIEIQIDTTAETTVETDEATQQPKPVTIQTQPIASDSETDIEDIIFRVRNSITPQKPKKERKKRVVKPRATAKKNRQTGTTITPTSR